MNQERTVSFSADDAYDLVTTLSTLALGRGDASLRIDKSGRVRLGLTAAHGCYGIELHRAGNSVEARIVGPEPDRLVPLLPGLLGLDFQPPSIDTPRRLRDLARRFTGFRLPRAPFIFPCLVQVVLQQLVSYGDACDGWRRLVRRHGQPISGDDNFAAAPTANVLSRLAVHQYIECGILPQHARRIIGLARVARRIESLWDGGMTPDAAERTCRLLAQQRGVGPWTIGYLRGAAMQDSDAVVLGDYGFPKRVAHFFTGQDEADDDEMLRLLEPFRPHRFYVLSLLLKSGLRPPRRGPRRTRLRDRLQLRE